MAVKEELCIILGALNATDHIPVDSINIVCQRIDQSDTASFTVEDGEQFELQAWMTVSIFDPGSQTGFYFYGYITSISSKRRGVKIDYQVNCEDLKVRLQKSVVDGSFEGTDADILQQMLAAATPDLSDLFDFSAITDTVTDLSLTGDNKDMLSLMSDMENMTQGTYSFQYPNDDKNRPRFNWIPNPGAAVDSMGYEFAPSAYSLWWTGSVLYPAFIAGTAVWGSGYGYAAGGFMLTLTQTEPAGGGGHIHNNSAWLTIAEYDSEVYRLDVNTAQILDGYIHFGLRMNCGTLAVGQSIWVYIDLVILDEFNNLIYEAVIPQFSMIYNGSGWQLKEVIFLMSAITARGDFPATLPPSTHWELNLLFVDHSGTPIPVGTVFYVDDFIFELVKKDTYDSFPAYYTGYFDGSYVSCDWLGNENASTSICNFVKELKTTPTNAPFNIDIGTSTDVQNFEFNEGTIDSANTVIVVGGNTLVDIDWIYPANNKLVHFDLEQQIFPPDGDYDFPRIYRNTGTDIIPVWTEQEVGDWNIEDLANFDVLYNPEQHWVLWAIEPPELKSAWRVVGKIKKVVRVTVQDEEAVTEDGVVTVTVVDAPEVSSEDEAFTVGNNALNNQSDTKHITFDTETPGLAPGQTINIVDTAQGINEDMIIERTTRKYLGGGYVVITVECGTIPPDAVDIIVGMDDELNEPYPLNSVNATVSYLYDENHALLSDENSLPLAGEPVST